MNRAAIVTQMLQKKECSVIHILSKAAFPAIIGIVIAFVAYYVIDIFTLTYLKKWANVIFWVIIALSIIFALWSGTGECRQISDVAEIAGL